MSSDSRSIAHYIHELRECPNPEAEARRAASEAKRIELTFAEDKTTLAQKRKYVAKLVVNWILGHPTGEVGITQAINLMSSDVPSQKHMGYLALHMLLHDPTSPLTQLAVGPIVQDLESSSEGAIELALYALANSPLHPQLSDLCVDRVLQLLTGPHTTPKLRKLASVALIKLFSIDNRKDYLAREWAPQLNALLNPDTRTFDLTILIVVVSLISHVAPYAPDLYASSISFLAEPLLELVSAYKDSGEPRSHSSVYYNVPAPWFIVAALNLVKILPSPTLPKSLVRVLRTILTEWPPWAEEDRVDAQKTTPSGYLTYSTPQETNAAYAVIFEASNALISRIAASSQTYPDLLESVKSVIGKSIAAPYLNIKYGGLQALCNLILHAPSLTPWDTYEPQVLSILSDRDETLKRLSLDVLFLALHSGLSKNSRPIVSVLLEALASASPVLKPAIIARLILLLDSFFPDYTYVINVALSSILLGLNISPFSACYRVIHLVVNHEELQAVAIPRLVALLQTDTLPDPLLYVASYILGEFASEENLTLPPRTIFFDHIYPRAFTDDTSAPETRAVIVSLAFKWAAFFPDLRPDIITFLGRLASSVDVNIQQRASEYLAILEMNDEALLAFTTDEAPPFSITHSHVELSTASDIIPKYVTRMPPSSTSLLPVTEPQSFLKKYAPILLNKSLYAESDPSYAPSLNKDTSSDPPEPSFQPGHTAQASSSTSMSSDIEGLSLDAVNTSTMPIISTGSNISPTSPTHPPGIENSVNSRTRILENFPSETVPHTEIAPSTEIAPPTETTPAIRAPPTPEPESEKTPLARSTPPRESPDASIIQSPAANFQSPISTSSDYSNAPAATRVPIQPIQPQFSSNEFNLAPVQPAAPKDPLESPLLLNLIYRDEGLVYQDGKTQVAVRSEFSGFKGKMVFYVKNKLSLPMNAVTANVHLPEPQALRADQLPLSSLLIPPGQQIKVFLQWTCAEPFFQLPHLKLSFVIGNVNEMLIPCPIWITKFVQPAVLNRNDFFDRWRRIGGPPLESQVIFKFSPPFDYDLSTRLLYGCHLANLINIDMSSHNLVAAGMLVSEAGPVGLLVRIEPNQSAQLCRITVRATQQSVSRVVINLFRSVLEG